MSPREQPDGAEAPDALGQLQAEMRAGKISDAMWDLYTSRVLKPRGLVVMLLPYKHLTFDRARATTALRHIVHFLPARSASRI